jgi:hypothetical protein
MKKASAQKTLVGVITPLEEVSAFEVSETERNSMCHNKYFPSATNRRWRYNPEKNRVIWTDDSSEEDRIMVEDYLAKQEIFPDGHQ